MKILVTFFLAVAFLFPPRICTASKINQFLDSRSVIGQVYFTKQVSNISEKNQQKLAKIAAQLKHNPKTGQLIRVEGFASADGRDEKNLDLSMRRALAVKNFLQQYGLSVELFLTGFGEKSSSAGKLSKQRRVDIAVYEQNSVAAELFQNSNTVERFIIQ